MQWLPLASLVLMVQGEVPEPLSGSGATADQTVVQNLDDPVRIDDVEVSSRRGAAYLPPEIELNGDEIDALGAWDIGEVLKRLSETLGVGEEPMVIINGKRVPNSGVFSSFPPDALVRAEILPSGAAALYGGAPGRRVVNLVLQRRFSSHDGRMSGTRPTQGGMSSLSGDLRRSAIVGENTHQLGFRVSRETALRADERDRELTEESQDSGAITLRPDADLASANATLTRSLGEWASVFNLNGQVRRSHSVARINGVVAQSRRQLESLGGSVGFSGSLGGWATQANLNAQASNGREDGFTDTRNGYRSLGLNITSSRMLVDLPAGPIVANLSGSLMEGQSVVDRGGVRMETNFQMREGGGSLAIPLSKTNAAAMPGRLIGNLQATLGASLREVGGDGGEEVNGGLTWTPRKGVSLNGAWSTATDIVPDIQKSEPLYFGAPRVVFDFRTGEAVEITPILGGNPDLRSPHSERLTLTASLGPFTPWNLSGNLGFKHVQQAGGIGSLPELTEDVEAAFPDRIRRDADGRLVSIDYRPMNLSSSLTEGLTSNLSFNLPRPTGPALGEVTVLRVALSHNLQLKHAVALSAGRPQLDRLKGDGGGVSRQDARITLDARRGRWGLNASAWWQDGYRTRRVSGSDGPSDLVTDPITTVGLKISYLMTSSSAGSFQAPGSEASRRRSGGLQMNLEIENLFDARPGARLGDNSPAPGYGRDIQDPVGRTVRLTLQRRF
jgi:hypothetical protein